MRTETDKFKIYARKGDGVALQWQSFSKDLFIRIPLLIIYFEREYFANSNMQDRRIDISIFEICC